MTATEGKSSKENPLHGDRNSAFSNPPPVDLCIPPSSREFSVLVFFARCPYGRISQCLFCLIRLDFLPMNFPLDGLRTILPSQLWGNSLRCIPCPMLRTSSTMTEHPKVAPDNATLRDLLGVKSLLGRSRLIKFLKDPSAVAHVRPIDQYQVCVRWSFKKCSIHQNIFQEPPAPSVSSPLPAGYTTVCWNSGASPIRCCS